MSRPRILFASENIQLGGLVLLELARMHRAEEIELVAVWSDAQAGKPFTLDAKQRDQLIEAQTLSLKVGDNGANFGSVYIADYPALAHELELRYQRVDSFKSVPIKVAARGLKLDAAVVCGHGKIFAKDVMNAPRLGWVNLHPSLLPKYRGPMPGFWELRAGEKQSGVSMHLLTEGVDEGPLIAQESFELKFGMNFVDLVERQAELSATLIREHLRDYLVGRIKPAAQPSEGASYQGMPEPEDYVLDPDMSCEAVGSFVLGMRGIQDVGVWVAGKPFLITAVSGWTNDESGSPGQGEFLGGGKARYRAKDGWVNLLIKEFTQVQA